MRSADYWAKRLEALNEAQLGRGEAYVKKADEEYAKATAKIQADVDRWYARLAKNNNVSLADARQLLKANELREFKWTVDEYIKAGRENAVDQRWMKELENASAKVHISRLEALQTQMRQHVEVLTAARQAGTQRVLGEIYKDGYYKSVFELQKGFGVGASFAKLDKRQLETLLTTPWAPDGSNFSARIWGDRNKLVRELQTTLVQGLIRGDAPDKLTDAIARRMNVSREHAARLVLTESAYFSGQSTLAAYKELGVEEYQYVATLDKRTSEPCRKLDGEVFPIGEAQVSVNYPPMHAHCRSTTIPHYDDNIKQRSARGDDGKTYDVPGDMTYKQWEKKRAPEAAQPLITEPTPPDAGIIASSTAEPVKWYDETGKTAPKLASLKDVDLDALTPDVPRKLGNIDVKDTKAVNAYLEETEAAIRSAAEEHAVAITEAGEVLHVKGGVANVDITIIGKDKLKGSKVTHNHPDVDGAPGGSLSPEDVGIFFLVGLQGLRAADSERRYLMRRTKDEKLSQEEVDDFLFQARTQALENLTIEQALSGYDEKHLTMIQLALLIEWLTYEAE